MTYCDTSSLKHIFFHQSLLAIIQHRNNMVKRISASLRATTSPLCLNPMICLIERLILIGCEHPQFLLMGAYGIALYAL